MKKTFFFMLLIVFIFATGRHAHSADLEQYEYVLQWGKYGQMLDGDFDGPSGICLLETPSGVGVYVADRRNERIQEFSRIGIPEGKWGSLGSSDGMFNEPVAVRADKFGYILVVDRSNHRIQVFNNAGVFQTKWGSFGTGKKMFSSPEAVAVDPEGNVYVADTLNHRVQKFNSNGDFITKWGELGSSDGQFDEPRGVAVDYSGNIYVTDSNNNRIQKFGPLPGEVTPTFVAKWGADGAGDGQFNEPRGITVDRSENIFVADWGNHRVQKFTNRGQFITMWGSHGRGNGQFRNPSDVAVDTEGNVYVADFINDRIQKFKLFEPSPDPECLSVDPSVLFFDPTETSISEFIIKGSDVDFRGSEVFFSCADLVIGQPEVSSDGLEIIVDLMIIEGAQNCSGELTVTLSDGQELNCGLVEIERLPECISLEPVSVEADRQKTERVDVVITTEGMDVSAAIISFDCEDIILNKKSFSQDKKSMTVEFIILPEADSCVGNVFLAFPEDDIELDCGVLEIKRPARCVKINPEKVRVEGKEPHIEEVTISFEDADFEYADVSFDCPDIMVSRKDISEEGLIMDFIIWPEADNCTQTVVVSLPGGVELDCGIFQIIKEEGPQPCLFSFLLEDDEYDLELLARFRDETLYASKPGRALIGYYYLFSDDAVSVMERNNGLKQSAKFLLKPVIHVIDYLYQ